MKLIGQTTQPSFPGIDPKWIDSPGVKWLIIIGIFAIAFLVIAPLMKRVIAAVGDLLISIGQAFGSVRRTWREQMEDKIDAIEKKTDRVAQGTDAVIQAQNAMPDSPNVNPAIAERVAEIAANSDTAIHPAITTNTPTPEAITDAVAKPAE